MSMSPTLCRRDLLASLGLMAVGAGTVCAVAQQAAADVTVRHVLASRINELGEHLLAAETAGGKPALLSPLNLVDALAMLAPGARGNAAKALAKILGEADEMDRLGQALASASELKRAAAVWLPAGHTPLSPYSGPVSRQGGLVEALDFKSPEALSRINGWVADRTMKLIPAFLDRLPPDPGLVITAALYFAARWAVPFDPAATKPMAFTALDGRRSDHPFLHGTMVVPYAETDTWAAVRVPYAVADFEFIALVPSGSRPANQILQLIQQQRIAATLASLRFAKAEVELAMPRLNLEHASDFLGTLSKSSVAAAVASDADYGGITGSPVRISAIRQKVVLRLDEAGTEAAAATGVLADKAAVERVRVILDRPYIALVVHQPTGLHVVSALINHAGTS